MIGGQRPSRGCHDCVFVALAVGLGAFSSTAGAAPTSLTKESGGPDAGSVSCTGPTTCTAVSEYAVETFQNGVWQPDQSFNGIGSGADGRGGLVSRSVAADAAWIAPPSACATFSAPGRHHRDRRNLGSGSAANPPRVKPNRNGSVRCVARTLSIARRWERRNFRHREHKANRTRWGTETNGVWGPLTVVPAPRRVLWTRVPRSFERELHKPWQLRRRRRWLC